MASTGAVFSDDDKEKLQKLVKRCEIADQREAIRCVNCKNIPIQHYRNAGCTHVFCEECFEILKNKKCPGCDVIVAPDTKYKNIHEEKIYQLKTHCCFKKNGCQEIVKIKDLLEHSVECYDKLMRHLNEVQFLAKSEKEIKRKISTYERNDSGASSTVFVWKIDGVKQKLEDLHAKRIKQIESESFVTMEYGKDIKAFVRLMKLPVPEWIGIYFSFIWDDSMSKLSFPPMHYHRKTCILKDQHNNGDEIRDSVTYIEPSFIRKYDESFMNEINGAPFFRYSLLGPGNPYVHDDSILIKVVVEPLAALRKFCSSNNGVLDWKIEKFSKKKQMELDGAIFNTISNYFYSSPKGYRMQVWLSLSGGLEEKHLTATLKILTGEWDSDLPEHFSFKTTFMLLDLKNSENGNYVEEQTSKQEDVDSHFPLANPLQSVVEEKYLKDDTLHVRVIVEII